MEKMLISTSIRQLNSKFLSHKFSFAIKRLFPRGEKIIKDLSRSAVYSLNIKRNIILLLLISLNVHVIVPFNNAYTSSLPCFQRHRVTITREESKNKYRKKKKRKFHYLYIDDAVIISDAPSKGKMTMKV